jgi:hypothetical protein
MQVPHYASSLAPTVTLHQHHLLGQKKSRKSETNKIFPCAPKSLRTSALQPTCRTHSVDAAYEDPGETAIILAVPAHFLGGRHCQNSISVTSRGPGRVGGARRDTWKVRGHGGMQGGLLQPRKNHDRRASGQTRLSGALPTVVPCQGTNAMWVRSNTSSTRSYIGEPAPVWGNTQSCAPAPADTSGLNYSFIHPNTTLETAHAR